MKFNGFPENPHNKKEAKPAPEAEVAYVLEELEKEEVSRGLRDFGSPELGAVVKEVRRKHKEGR